MRREHNHAEQTELAGERRGTGELRAAGLEADVALTEM